MTTPITHFLAFDVESTGPNLSKHFCPAFGAALVEIATGSCVWKFHTFCAQPEGTEWDQFTLDDFWLTKARDQYDSIIQGLKTAPSAPDATRNFMNQARAAVAELVTGGVEAVSVVSDTAGYDSSWMDKMLAEGSMRTLLGKDKALRDINSWYLGIAEIIKPSKGTKPIDAACQALGISKPKYTVDHDHNPANDACHIAQGAAHVFRALQNGVKHSGSQSVIGNNNRIGNFAPKIVFN